MPEEKWTVIAKKADFSRLGKECNIDPVIARVLVNRGIDTTEAIDRYLHGTVSDLHSPALMKDLERAADIIKNSIEGGEKIMIVADYDTDGIFSGELLYEGLTLLGADAFVMTPHRIKDGYGINERIIHDGAAAGARLVLTCDNGISAASAIKLANELGMKCIVTDHHEVPYDETPDGRVYRLPAALAVVDPKQTDCPYPFKGLCGCGVALKLMTYMLKQAGKAVPDLFYIYAAIATVGDVMDLQDENRIIVKEGLKRLRENPGTGLLELIRACSLEPFQIGSYHIGFVLGPCFNAAGRLESVDPAIELLQAKTPEDAAIAARHLRDLNETRKSMTEDGVTRAIDIIEGKTSAGDNTPALGGTLADDKIILVALDDTHESIAGIIAGRLRERYNKPVIVFTRTEKCYKGSGRSIPAYHMHEGLTSCKDLIMVFGGHSQAAGLSVSFENLGALRNALNEKCALTEDDFIIRCRIDVPMPLDYISEELINQLELLEPTGTANERPVFAENHLRIRSASLIGKQKNILRMSVVNQNGYIMDAIMFSGAEKFIEEVDEFYGAGTMALAYGRRDNPIDAGFIYYPSVNEYMGLRTIQIIINRYRLN